MSDDDLPVLRRAMAGLAEHGGSTDLYERTLRTSRRLARRRAVASGAAVAAAVLAIGVPVALAQRQQSPALPPATVPSVSVSASAEPSTPAPTATPSATVAPTGTRTTGTTPTRRQTAHPPSSPTTSSPSSRPADTGCPVSAAILEDAADYPAGYRIKPADIRCSQGWATAEITAPSPEQQGDGVIIFRFARSTETWKKVGEGSDVRCADYDMPKSTGLCS